MKLRAALKADFGIDVLLERGSGTGDDPYVIEPCSAAHAIRTQLGVLNGLGRGRRELWRLLDVDTGREPGGTVQRLRIEAMSFSESETISETRVYCFDVSKVEGTPDAGMPLIEWADPRTRFSAPSQIAWMHFVEAIDNRPGEAALDTTIRYSLMGGKATVYVYGSWGRSREHFQKEFEAVCNEVLATHDNAEPLQQGRVFGPFAMQIFRIGTDMSIAGLATLGDHFVKLRLTHVGDPRMQKPVSDVLHDLARMMVASQYHA